MSFPTVPTNPKIALELKPSRKHCTLDKLRDYVRKLKKPLAIDLFCGAGGLSLGLQEAGFEVILGVDHFSHAADTHKAYFGGASLCADLSNPNVAEQIAEALEGVAVALVAGGPPCQPFSSAGKSKIRSLFEQGSWESDDRKDLWQTFVRVVNLIRPQAVLIENVPDMALNYNSVILRQCVAELEKLHYAVRTRTIPAWQYGVPQLRQRFFLVGTESGTAFQWPEFLSDEKPKLSDAIRDLPVIEGGQNEIELPYYQPKKLSKLQRWFRRGVKTPDRSKVFDHVVRSVREDDLEAFRLMDHKTKYTDLPDHLKRYRDDIFDDKYKRLSWDEPSRSITAHIAKDGYWYIHPEQHRTLSIREAARIQTFPDWFRFAGNRVHAYRQIGEAVPPLLGRELGKSLLTAIADTKPGKNDVCISTSRVAKTLEQWFNSLPENKLTAPWRRERKLWYALMGTILFERMPLKKMQMFWATCKTRWSDAQVFLSDADRQVAIRAIGRGKQLETMDAIANALAEGIDLTNLKISGARESQLEAAMAMSGVTAVRPPTASIVRVAERVFGDFLEKSSIGHDQIVVSRLVGVDPSGNVYAAALELGDQVCKSAITNCPRCPLNEFCVTARQQKH